MAKEDYNELYNSAGWLGASSVLTLKNELQLIHWANCPLYVSPLSTAATGDDFRQLVVESLTEPDRQELMLLQSLPAKYQQGKRAAVVVCHSVPTNWVYPEPMWAAGAPCPPDPAEHAWVYQIGRTMFETDKLPAIFVPR
jgi:hypothetical protein